MKHFAWPSISAFKGRLFQQFCITQSRSKGEPAIKCEMDCLQEIKETICRKTFTKFRLALVNGWIEKTPLTPKEFQRAIQTLKQNCLSLTEQLSGLKQPFRRPNSGEGHIHDLKIDEIYVNVAIHEGTAHHKFAEDLDRLEQFKEYPPDPKDCYFAKPEDIIDKEHSNVLVVGRPGIGKTSLCIKMIRRWASGEAFCGDHHEKSSHFNVVFLVKFRGFNNNAELSLRELLARAETVQHLDDPVWDFINQEPTKVLFIFDGLDEYSRKEDINTHEDDPTYKNDVEEKMPVSLLYNKLAAGKLLRGASILTTTRATAVKYVDHVTFQRTVEIRGFTSKDVEEYVEKFTRSVPGAKEKMLQHIKSNINFFSLCYSPVNCFLICHCLLHIILFESSQALPTKTAKVYKMVVKMLFLNHNREAFSLKELEKLKSTHMYEPFENFPEELQNILRRLGEIAFKGIEKGRLLFESSEVKGLQDCGLLHKLPDLEPKGLDDPPKFQFCFIHLTVQEFFAAKHLVDTETKKKIERFACKYVSDGTWQVVLQFVAGLLKSSSTNIFINLLPKSTKKTNSLSSEREKLIFWPIKDKTLAVKVCKYLYEINDEQQSELQHKIGKINFNTVNFSGCSLASIDLASVLHFLENAETVLHINLSSNELGDFGAEVVQKFIVKRKRKLVRLDLSNNKFTDKAVENLAKALKHSNCKLNTLNLSHNKFTDKAVEDLAIALKHSNCKLNTLNLSHNKFTDKAVEDLAIALKHSYCKLKTLNFSDNNFTEEGRQHLIYAGNQSNCKVII